MAPGTRHRRRVRLSPAANALAVVAALAVQIVLSGCVPRSGPALMRSADRHWRKGRWTESCRLYSRVLDVERSPSRWQRAARRYTRCMARTGQLAAARRRAETRVRTVRDAAAYYLLAFVEVASGAGRLKQAESALGAALRVGSDTEEPTYRLGLLLLEDERFVEAERLLRRAVRNDATRPGPRIALARALAVMGRRSEALDLLRTLPDRPLSRAQVRRAETVAALAIESAAPMTARTRKTYDRAAALMERDLPGRATQMLEQALRDHGPEPSLYRLAGMAHLALGNSALAVVHLTRALELNPADGRSAALLGAFLWSKGRRRQAERLLRQAVRTDPVSNLAHTALGDLLLRTNRAAESSATLARAVHLSGDKIRPMRLWARALMAAGKIEKAESVLRRAVRKHPEDYATHMLRGDLYMKRYRTATDSPAAERYYENARRAFKKAASIKPGDVKALDRLKSLDPRETGRSSP